VRVIRSSHASAISIFHCVRINTCCVAVHQVALEGLRIKIPPGISHHMSRMVKICMNEDPAKRPRFDMIIPILEKMKSNA